MISEIKRLRLPFGKWQEYATELIQKHNKNLPKDCYSYLGEPPINCSYPDERTVRMNIGCIAHFELSFLYGCKAILISHDTYIEPHYRGLGFAGSLQLIKERMAKDLMAKILIATAVETNAPQQKVLAKWKWDTITTFENNRTGNTVGFFIKHL